MAGSRQGRRSGCGAGSTANPRRRLAPPPARCRPPTCCCTILRTQAVGVGYSCGLTNMLVFTCGAGAGQGTLRSVCGSMDGGAGHQFGTMPLTRHEGSRQCWAVCIAENKSPGDGSQPRAVDGSSAQQHGAAAEGGQPSLGPHHIHWRRHSRGDQARQRAHCTQAAAADGSSVALPLGCLAPRAGSHLRSLALRTEAASRAALLRDHGGMPSWLFAPPHSPPPHPRTPLRPAPPTCEVRLQVVLPPQAAHKEQFELVVRRALRRRQQRCSCLQSVQVRAHAWVGWKVRRQAGRPQAGASQARGRGVRGGARPALPGQRRLRLGAAHARPRLPAVPHGSPGLPSAPHSPPCSLTMLGVVPTHRPRTPSWRTTRASTAKGPPPAPPPFCMCVFTRSVGLEMPAASAPASMPAATLGARPPCPPSAPSSDLMGV